MKVSKEGGTVAKKVRKEGVPSSHPPADGPAWTVGAEVRTVYDLGTGTYIHHSIGIFY